MNFVSVDWVCGIVQFAKMLVKIYSSLVKPHLARIRLFFDKHCRGQRLFVKGHPNSKNGIEGFKDNTSCEKAGDSKLFDYYSSANRLWADQFLAVQ